MRVIQGHRLVIAIVHVAVLMVNSGCCLNRHLPPRAFDNNVNNVRPDDGSSIMTDEWDWSGFREPASHDPSKHVMLEPYEPGRIPVVFIHGLLAQPRTWRDVIGALRSNPRIRRRFQFWLFHYPTGVSFLQSALDLRRELRSTIDRIDPGRRDPALKQMVLVGHSMGGLLAKLQVTHNDEALWKAASDHSFDDFDADAETRRQVYDTLFFEPLPFASRVVFIGTTRPLQRFRASCGGTCVTLCSRQHR